MISPNDYIAAIAEKLRAAFPDEQVYTEQVPEDFGRPSNAIEAAKASLQIQSKDVTLSRVELVIRTFTAVDQYHNSRFAALYDRAARILRIFACGYLCVTDSHTGLRRAAKVASCECPVLGLDYADVRVGLTLHLDAQELGAQDMAPIMETFDLRTQIQT